MEVLGNSRYQSTEDKIEKAVFVLLKKRGYDKFSIKDVCAEAGINRSSFYAHYEDINDMMIALEGRLSKKLQKIWQPSNPATVFDQNVFIEFFTFIAEHKEFYKAFLKSNSTSFVAGDMLKKHKTLFKQFQSGKNFNYSDSEIDYHLHWFGGGLKAISGRWIQNDCKETPEQMAKIIQDEYTNNAKSSK